ncbi:putative trans-sialidase [Trypanosoma cruzi]|nr:putative trans-sialidase [Trypanosoma cruzi]
MKALRITDTPTVGRSAAFHVIFFFFESVHKEPSTANTLAGDKQHDDPEGETHACTAVGTNSGPDSFSSTEMTPADVATAAPEPGTDPATAHHNGNVLDGAGPAPAHSSTTPGKTKVPSEFNAAPALGSDPFDLESVTALVSVALRCGNTVHGCVSRVLLLLLVGLWGAAALC